MRVLCCLLLGWSVLLSDVDAKAANESQAAAVATNNKLSGKVTFDEEENRGKPVVGINLSGAR